MMVKPISPVEQIAAALRDHPSIRSKLAIGAATRDLNLTALSAGQPGDDAAALWNGVDYDLIAGEGFIPAFVADDPWFAGWCAVMVNLSDIAAMGGRATAIVDQVWAPDAVTAAPILQGLRDASETYGVPIVGGHTNFAAPAVGIAASIMGKADAVITSFDAQPGDLLIAAVDHRGAYRNFDNFCAALTAPADRLRGDLALLPELARGGLVHAGKDISQGGIIGTALMLAECSDVGIDIDLGAVTPPAGVDLDRWLRSFPSFGFLLSVAPEHANAVCARFAERGIDAGAIGTVTADSRITLTRDGDQALFWDHADTPYLGLKGSSNA